jgi:hypothetical protein
MEYVVKHYIPAKRGMLTPGEIVSDLPEELIPRLLEKGAIEEIAPASTAASKPAKTATTKADSVPETAEVEAEEVETDDAELEIDALDGVVTAPKEEKPKTRRASSKAKGGKA